MRKTYILKNNQFIIYPGTGRERNITEEGSECKYCTLAPRGECGHYHPNIDYPACDWFTFSDEWEDITEY
jgi:hypothetical protein